MGDRRNRDQESPTCRGQVPLRPPQTLTPNKFGTADLLSRQE
jgi:hypothetical protein